MYNKKKETYRIMSIFIVILMLMSTFFNISAFAENNALSFVYDSYIIEYTLNNEWENNQNVEIKLTNTGNETIYKWALDLMQTVRFRDYGMEQYTIERR